MKIFLYSPLAHFQNKFPIKVYQVQVIREKHKKALMKFKLKDSQMKLNQRMKSFTMQTFKEFCNSKVSK
ncbi:CLUMA_CG002458, isoform A [Clunio marinus]|uniref:CLUMA_CG002458, isoform A n=1 Tax=Clunio marinus TaxID=568069 RepID=A0A1J1HQD0_9DIPT|nr:CLUMA_CG002458, isoform A [Clunio marinus]